MILAFKPRRTPAPPPPTPATPKQVALSSALIARAWDILKQTMEKAR